MTDNVVQFRKLWLMSYTGAITPLIETKYTVESWSRKGSLSSKQIIQENSLCLKESRLSDNVKKNCNRGFQNCALTHRKKPDHHKNIWRWRNCASPYQNIEKLLTPRRKLNVETIIVSFFVFFLSWKQIWKQD